MLTSDELERYNRQIMIRGFGEAGQGKLKKARVIVVGCGGLGSAASVYLAAAGVGTLGLVDCDEVELSNLNRQVVHWDDDIGRRKVISASEKLSKLNPGVNIETIDEAITEANVSRLLSGFDVIVDATDNIPVRYLLNRFAVQNNVPFVHGAVHGLEGRAMTVVPGEGACLRCVYRVPVAGDKPPVLGATPAIIGCIEAAEAIKYIVGIGKLLTDRLLLYDGLNMRFIEFKVKRDPDCEHCGHLPGRDVER